MFVINVFVIVSVFAKVCVFVKVSVFVKVTVLVIVIVFVKVIVLVIDNIRHSPAMKICSFPVNYESVMFYRMGPRSIFD